MNYSLGNTLSRGGSLNADGLSLDLQLATDKTLTARKGPTPTFTRASTATYFAPSHINAVYTFDGNNYNVNVSQTTLINGRYRWENGDTGFYYTGTAWSLSHDGNDVATSAPASNAWRPDLADWSGTGAVITATSTFGLVTAATNEPRFDHDTTAPNACRGLLMEESRTNLVFPSATLTTQTRTVTAVAHTLSFYGTGTVVLSGTHVATVTGTGAYPTRTTLTFTPTAGSLIMTVTGSVTEAQLEAGAFATSYIPTTSASVVRSADLCTITGADFTTVYNESEHTLFAEASGMSHVGFPSYLSFDNSTSGEQSTLAGFPTTNRAVCSVSDGGVTSVSVQIAVTLNQNNKMAAAMKLNSFQLAVNNVLGTEDTSGTMPTATSLKIGRNWSSVVLNGTFKQVKVFRKRLSNAKLQALTI